VDRLVFWAVAEAKRRQSQSQLQRTSWSSLKRRTSSASGLQAVVATDLAGTLSGDGPYTVFAPNDAAFADLPEGTLDELLKPENKAELADLLLYHVVPGSIKAGDLAEGQEKATELTGAHLVIIKKDGKVTANDAEVKTADQE